MSREVNKLPIPINLFLSDIIDFIIEKFNAKEDFFTYLQTLLFEFFSSNGQKSKSDEILERIKKFKSSIENNNKVDFEKIFRNLFQEMLTLYNDSTNTSSPYTENHLLIFGVLLGNNELRYACKNAASINDLCETKIDSIKQITKLNPAHIKLPDDIELEPTFVDKITSGTFAEIYGGKYQYQDIVFKKFKTKLEGKTLDDIKKTTQKEIKIHSSIDCPQIPKLIGIIPGYPLDIMVIEYVGIDLVDKFNEMIRSNIEFSDDQLKSMIADLIEAICYLHSKNIIHRDIKPENILFYIDHKGICHLKLADLGLAKQLTEEKQTSKKALGSIGHAAPEILNELLNKKFNNFNSNIKPYTNKVDIYSFGIILFELLFIDLFEEQFNKEITNEYNKNLFFVTNIIQGKRPEIPDKTPPKLSTLIQICWQNDPNKRPSIKEIKKDFEREDFFEDDEHAQSMTFN